MTLGPHSPFSIGYLDNIAPEDSGEEEAPDVFPERLATKVMKKNYGDIWIVAIDELRIQHYSTW